MPRVIVQENTFGDAVDLDRPAGGRLFDIVEPETTAVQFSCTDGNCGMCRSEIVRGGDLLSPIEAKEAERLKMSKAPANQRLVCQAKLLPGEGEVEIRWAAVD
jgi:ferredoxin